MRGFETEQNLIENKELLLNENDKHLSDNIIYVSKPNNSLSPFLAIYLVAIISLFILMIALSFAKIGAWPVLIYAFAVIIGLSLAFQHAFKHAGDSEKLSIQDGVLHLEIKELEDFRRYEVNAYWAELITKYFPDGDCRHLAIRSRGREIKIGRHLNANNLNQVAIQLKAKLRELK